jgi:ABC-type multidrug transport system fused ATPase/permease subunit
VPSESTSKWESYPKALQERIISATQLANAFEFVSTFPNGFDTDVGANGVSMSGIQLLFMLFN